MRLASLAVLATAALSFSPSARAEHARMRSIVEESVRLQEARAADLERVAAADLKESRELREAARARVQAAESLEAQADEMHAAARQASDPGDRRMLEEFSREMRQFATADREFAEQRHSAATILERQAREAEAGARHCREHIGRIRAHFVRWYR